ncbi:ABC transporter substrate-binding protein [Paenibacillus sp. GCM10027626]|uniref:ABC transporter substrate-binding protein n=1 Tax=Paenibacillus sp. GCM10027626 TaxID=3273411 RepID=UPI003640970B
MKKNIFKSPVAMMLAMIMIIALIGCSNTPSQDGGSSQDASGGSQQPEKPVKKEKMVFWDKSEYVAEYNAMMKERAEQFGKEHGIEVEYVIVSPNDMEAKLMAAVEGKNPPDLVMTHDTSGKQFAAMDQLVDMSDIYQKVDFTDTGKKVAYTKKGEYVIPQAILAGAMYLRKDKWDEKGLDYPDTWQEVLDTAQQVNDPKNGFYAVGFPIGASGGGDAMSWLLSVVHGYGGMPVDENDNITINSPETLEALKLAAKFYELNLTPPASVTWDDMGNNTAYLAGTAGIIFNSGSVQAAMAAEKPELLKNTVILPMPAGPVSRFNAGSANVFIVFKNGKNTAAAKLFIEEFFQPEFYNSLIEQLGGHWQPAVKGMEETEFWKKPENQGWLKSAESTVPATHPAESNEVSMKTVSEQLLVKAVQKIVVNKMDPQQALDELEADYKRVYRKQ